MQTSPNKLRSFYILFAGQALSLLGTGMTRFAVMIWAFEKQGTATTLALLGFFTCISYVVASPFAGVLVDRWDRRKVMLVADLGAGLMTGAMLVLFASGRLEIWHLYLAEVLAGAFEAFQEPAYFASISLLVPREQYTRVNGLIALGRSSARVFAPALAGLALQAMGLGAVMAIDLATLALALASLALFVRIPAPPVTLEGRQAAGNFWHQVRFGFAYIYRRPGLRGLLLTFFMMNFFGTVTYFAVLSPLVLTRSGGNEITLGIVRTVMGVGGVVGGLFISLWGGPRRKVYGYLLSMMFSFLLGDLMMAVSRSVGGWAFAGFFAELTIPFIISPYFALWQELTPPDVQGRIFATRDMIQVTSQPVGYLAGGLLADRLFEPFMGSGSPVAGLLSQLVGSGPGSGMAVMFLMTSLLGSL
ncbi:MAG: MFS transporter, partial [Chloroflexota bacterium]